MSPRRAINSGEGSIEDEEDVTTTSESGESSCSEEIVKSFPPKAKGGLGTVLVNNPNDERHVVEDSKSIRTPPDNPLKTTQRSTQDVKPQEHVIKDINPTSTSPKASLYATSLQSRPEGAPQLLHNHPNDERVTVDDGHNIPTPRGGGSKGGGQSGGVLLRNAPHDEAIPLSPHGSSVCTPSKLTSGRHGAMAPTDNDESTDDESDEMNNHSRGYNNNQRPEAIDTEAVTTATPIPNLEYKPQDFAKINATANREMQELFKHILDYQPVIPELPAKLRPFIPDYVPSIGDLDPFCKITRPDGRPDGLGIYVLDEPSVMQSNPAVVLLELRATNIYSNGGLTEVVDSFEDAANRPEVIDRWIADVKKVHCKKPLPTTNYQKPMPEIESLLQVWPHEFEEFLNSDIQFPPPNIDMDLDQYVRTLCCILDVPTHNSLIDSLHVMFTLYQEFRANQHFQHESGHSIHMSSPTWSVYEGEWDVSCDDTDHVPPELALCGCGLRQKCLLQRGAQGAVYLAEDGDGNLFAVKRHFTQRSDFGLRGISEGALREATLLTHIAERADTLDLKGDFGVLSLKRIVEAPFQEICLILEMCPLDLSKIYLRKKSRIRSSSLHSSELDSRCPILAKMSVIKYLLRGILKIIRCLHEDCHIIHRDVKMSNLLVGENGQIRLADFGSARLLHDPVEKSFTSDYREYTPAAFRTTLIYQAPECLLGNRSYTTAVDMWAVGVVFAELLLQRHLFRGCGELAMLCEIWKLLGTPCDNLSEEIIDSAITYAIRTEATISLLFSEKIVSSEGLHLLKQMLEQDPKKRITAAAALSHPFLNRSNVDGGQEEEEEARLLWQRKVQECAQEVAKNIAVGVPPLYMNEDDSDDEDESNDE